MLSRVVIVHMFCLSLIAISSLNAAGQLQVMPLTVIDVLTRSSSPLDAVCAYNGGGILAAEANRRPSQVLLEIMSAECLAILGAQPALGRLLTDDEAPAARSGLPVVLIGNAF